MSDHNVDESGTNRTFLCVALLIVIIGVAAAATKSVPKSADLKSSGRVGVVIMKDGAVHDGTVLVRGGVITVIRKGLAESPQRSEVMLFEEDFDRAQRSEGVLVTHDGSVLRGHTLVREGGVWLLSGNRATAHARSDVRYFDADSSELGPDYYGRFPRKSYPTLDERAPKPQPVREIGCVVLESGDVFVGALVLGEESVEVHQENGALTVVPAAAIRWTATGTDRPTDAYWKLHGSKVIDPRFARQKAPDGPVAPPANADDDSQKNWTEAAKNPAVAKAIMANSQGRWGEASDLWIELYTEQRWAPFLQNFTNCSSKWVEESIKFFRRDVLLNRVNRIVAKVRESKMLDNPQVKVSLSKTLGLAIRATNKNGYPKTAHDLVSLMSSLGEDYKAQADAVWKGLTPPKMNFEGDGDDH